MYIEINDNSTLREIQQAFNNFYPYLQLEFFLKPHKKYESSPEKNKAYPGETIGDLKQTHVSGVIDIHPWYKASAVEREFLDRFGLSAQILVKENDHWKQTTGLDDFTLKELNELSRNASDEFIVEDYEESINQEVGMDKPVFQ
jgi:glycerol-3-phosphate O-acyltransferase